MVLKLEIRRNPSIRDAYITQPNYAPPQSFEEMMAQRRALEALYAAQRPQRPDFTQVLVPIFGQNPTGQSVADRFFSLFRPRR